MSGKEEVKSVEVKVAKVKFVCGVKTKAGGNCKRNVKEEGLMCVSHVNMEPLPETTLKKVETHECGFLMKNDKKCQKMTSNDLCSVHIKVLKKREIHGEKAVVQKEFVLCLAETKKGKECQKKVVSGKKCWIHSD